jgi:hypothetical protein
MSSGHVWRGDNGHERHPERDFLRKHLPHAAQGQVVLDLDLVLRVYGRDDQEGRFRLVELKKTGAPMAYGETRTFRLIDRLLRQADPTGRHYDGFHVIETATREWETLDIFVVNGVHLDRDDFIAWCNFRLDVAPSRRLASA